MIQEQITICFLDGEERQFTKDYNTIMNELRTEDYSKVLLYDYETGKEVDQNNLEFFSKLIAVRDSDISSVYENYQKMQKLKREPEKQDCQINKIKSEKWDKIEKQIPDRTIEEIDLKQKCKNQEMEIERLKSFIKTIENALKESEAKREQTKNENQQKLRMLNDYKSNNQKLIDQNSQQSDQINQLNQEKQQQTEKITLLESQSQALQREYQMRTEELIQLQSQSLRIQNQGSQQSQNPTTSQTANDLNNFYSDEKKQEYREKNNLNQVKFLESIIQKISDDNKEQKKINSKNETSQAIIFSQWLNIYSIQLDEYQFSQSIQKKNFFFRKNCLIKKIVSQIAQRQLHQGKEIEIQIDNQIIKIKNVYDIYQAEYEALDIILNILLTEGYAKLFERDLQQANNQNELSQLWNYKIPRQFLIQDDIGNYHIYQECLGNTTKQFIAYQTTQIVDQYLSSFFKYFYLATNKNLAITECQLAEQRNINQNEVVIESIVIHSKYQKTFSQLDLGIVKIIEFERKSQVPLGAIQQYWSEALKILAEKIWYDQ